MFIIRLWHYKLLPVLPDRFIVAEWRECLAIKRQWEKGTLKHRLVSYVMDQDKATFLCYVFDIIDEMKKRGIKYQEKYFSEIFKFCDVDFSEVYPYNLHYTQHNNRYLLQCYYNLEEKYDRGIVSFDEFQKIQDILKECDL